MQEGMSINTIVDRNATVASVRFSQAGFEFCATGSSKRESGDVFDPRIGSLLATARAMRSLAVQMEKEAGKLVEEAAVDKIVALVRQTIRQELPPEPKPQLSLTEIQEKYGLKAAYRARKRRDKAASTEAYRLAKEQERASGAIPQVAE